MSLKKLNLFILAGAVALGIMACKKDEETTVAPFMNGSLDFSVPTYVKPKTKITMTPVGVEHPDGEGIGYYWKVTPTMTKYDTTRFVNGLDKNGNPSDGSFTHTFSDTLQTYSIYAYAYAKGYTASSASESCTVVSGGPNESITNIGLSSATPSVKINGKTYYYTTAGGNDWLRTNLSDGEAGAPYYNCSAMSDVFGRYYSYEEALTACPEGWELPTDADWIALAKEAGAKGEIKSHNNIPGVAAALMGDARFNDTNMWEYWPEVGDITNATGMSMISAGYAMLGKKNDNAKTDPAIEYNYPNAIFKGYREYAVFWTADVVENEEGMAYYRYLIAKQPDLQISKGDTKTFGASVRCIRKK